MGQLTNTTAEIQEQMDGVYAEIYAHENLTTQSIPTGAGYTKVTNFTNNGGSSHCTADQANNKITITKTGEYNIEFSTSFTATGTNVNWFGAVFVDGVEQDNIHFERKLSIGGDYGSTNIAGMVSISSVPVDVDVRFRHDDGASLDLTKKYMNLKVNRSGI